MARLTAERLAFAYGPATVLSELTLSVHGGEVVGLVGPNGSGKSTLLKCLAGVLPTASMVRYDSEPLEGLAWRERSRRRAYVPQGVAMAFPYRVDEVVAMALAHRSPLFHAPHEQATVAAALAAVGFAAPLDQRFDRLSGGEQQQVLVARALAPSTGVILLDEPTSSLDLRHRADVVGTLRRRAAAGVAVLMAMHDLNLAALCCHRLLLLAKGRLRHEGTPAEVLRPELLGEVYGARVVCGTHPTAGVPTVELDPAVWQ